MISFCQAIKLAFARAFSLQGRSSRAEYWWVQLAFVLVGILSVIALVICYAASVDYYDNPGALFWIALCLMCVLYVGMMIINISTTVRRIHDFNHSGWFVLFIFAPYVGYVASIVFGIIEGTPGVNRYGINPLSDLKGHYDYYRTKQFKTYGAYGAHLYREPQPFNYYQQPGFQGQPQQGFYQQPVYGQPQQAQPNYYQPQSGFAQAPQQPQAGFANQAQPNQQGFSGQPQPNFYQPQPGFGQYPQYSQQSQPGFANQPAQQPVQPSYYQPQPGFNPSMQQPQAGFVNQPQANQQSFANQPQSGFSSPNNKVFDNSSTNFTSNNTSNKDPYSLSLNKNNRSK